MWVDGTVVLAIHDAQVAEHGGASGVRGEAALDAALSRPQNLAIYGEPPPDLADLAAACAFAIVRNHAFLDGNKRTSAVVTELFIRLNEMRLAAVDAEIVLTWLTIADDSLDESAFAAWLRSRLRGA
ncbi:type II toxin-antitoxin system death-on-curing family toxin [uncultured Methylobacterium sp.]|uniref:type II toxin-antitoxin system death-on-curing family toxin n=1 Tax=uncultured Methylobacterium sp. TaxID=157278 RepID=UPI0035CA3485